MAHGPTHPVTLECERLIWALNPYALSEQAAADADTWAGSVQSELIQFGTAPSLTAPASRQLPYLGAAAVMMVKDEADIIGENLRWLHFVGFRRIVILDNTSTDATADLIQRFRRDTPDAEIITVNDPLVRYMQAEKTTGLYRMALSIWPDIRWVFPIDADEFLVPMQGLTVLESIETAIDALTIPKVIHFLSKMDLGFNDTNFFPKMAYRSPLFVVPPKIAARHNPIATITQGNHKIRLSEGRSPIYAGAFRHGFYYREFPTRSFEQFTRKIRNGGRAILAAEDFLGRPVGGDHWKRYYEFLTAGGEQRLLDVYRQEWIKENIVGYVVDPFFGCSASIVEI